MVTVYHHGNRFANHQQSKKHKENAAVLRALLEEEDFSQDPSLSATDKDNQSDDSIGNQSDDSIEADFKQLIMTGSPEDSIEHIYKQQDVIEDDCSFDGTHLHPHDSPSLPDVSLPTTVNLPVVDDCAVVCGTSDGNSDNDIPLAMLRYQ